MGDRITELTMYLLDKTPDSKGRKQVTISKGWKSEIKQIKQALELTGMKVTLLYDKYSVTIYIHKGE